METQPPKLLKRMQARPWSNGTTFTYRYLPLGGRPVNLGTDLTIALAKAAELSGAVTPADALDPKMLQETWERHRKGAKQRGIAFDLGVGDLQRVLDLQGGRCAVTNLIFSSSKPAGLRIRPWLPSIDRKNSLKGYVSGNIRVVCAFVNVAMNGFGESLFRQVLQPLVDQAVEERLQALGISTGNTTLRQSTEIPVGVDPRLATLSR